MKYGTIILVIVVACSFGCGKMVTEGSKFDAAKVNGIMVGSTTSENLTEAFGKPEKTETMSSDEQKYTYRYYYKNPHWWTTDEVQSQNLEVILKNNRVERYNYKEQSAEYIDRQPPQFGLK